MMRTLDERRTAELSTDPALSIQGAMQVRGFEAMVRGRGVRYERREPHSLLVRRGHGPAETITIPNRPEGPPGIAVLAVPILAFAAIRLLGPRRKGK